MDLQSTDGVYRYSEEQWHSSLPSVLWTPVFMARVKAKPVPSGGGIQGDFLEIFRH
jgi:hypothetical protein